MKTDQVALQRAIRTCYDKMYNEPSVKNKWNITPANLRAEIAYAATTTQYQYQFAANSAVQATATLNNVNMGENDLFWWGAMQFQLGLGANANNRAYRSYGFTPSDNTIYNATMSAEFESGKPIVNMPMQWFYEEGETPQLSGVVVLPTVRRLFGKMSNILFTINCGSAAVNITGLTLTANLFTSFSLVGVQARP